MKIYNLQIADLKYDKFTLVRILKNEHETDYTSFNSICDWINEL
jgi:hypothetical protein